MSLINARPNSPQKYEIEALLGQMIAGRGDAPTDAQTVAAWHRFAALKQELKEHLARTADDADGEEDAEFNRLSNALDTFAKEIWEKPVRDWGDVLLRGEVALYHENGVMEALDDPETYLEERANAQLIDAVVTIGRRHFGLPDDQRREGDV